MEKLIPTRFWCLYPSLMVGFFGNRAIRGCFRMTMRIVHTFMDIAVFLNLHLQNSIRFAHCAQYILFQFVHVNIWYAGTDGRTISPLQFLLLTRTLWFFVLGAGRDICITLSLAGNNNILRDVGWVQVLQHIPAKPICAANNCKQSCCLGFNIWYQPLGILLLFLLHDCGVILLDELGFLRDLQQLQSTGIPIYQSCLIMCTVL